MLVEQLHQVGSALKSREDLPEADDFHAVTQQSFDSRRIQVASDGSLNPDHVRQLGITFVVSKLFEGVIVKDFENAADVVEIRSLRVDVEWKPPLRL